MKSLSNRRWEDRAFLWAGVKSPKRINRARVMHIGDLFFLAINSGVQPKSLFKMILPQILTSWITRRVSLTLVFVCLGIALASASDSSYWVWHRSTLFDGTELAGLKQAGVKALYWQVGTLVPAQGGWSWQERFPIDLSAVKKETPFLHIIPVVRLEPKGGQQLPSADNFAHLGPILDEIATSSGADFIQIDYEPPDRLIPQYEGFLRSLHQQGHSWKISISALAHWAKFANDFQGLADEITPMFYDLNPNREVLTAGLLPPLIDATVAEEQMASWKSCKLPWKAGLPNFCRVTIVNQQGVSRGNVRRWNTAELWFSPALTPGQPTIQEQTTFSVTQSSVLLGTLLQSKERVIVRYPEQEALLRLQSVAKEFGARGVLFFRLSDRLDMSGYSVATLAQSSVLIPRLSARRTPSGSIVLRNDSTQDLLPRILANGQRGYALELKSEAGMWREAVPGDFSMVTTDAEAKSPVSDTIGMGVDSIFFWFSSLRAGESLETGLVQNHSEHPLNWRISNLDSDLSWHPLE